MEPRSDKKVFSQNNWVLEIFSKISPEFAKLLLNARHNFFCTLVYENHLTSNIQDLFVDQNKQQRRSTVRTLRRTFHRAEDETCRSMLLFFAEAGRASQRGITVLTRCRDVTGTDTKPQLRRNAEVWSERRRLSKARQGKAWLTEFTGSDTRAWRGGGYRKEQFAKFH